VRIKGHGYDKINAAFAYGGENLTHRTVEDFLGISVDYYIIINTHSFVKIIDALGGIDVDVEKRMYYESIFLPDRAIGDEKSGASLLIRTMRRSRAVTKIETRIYKQEGGPLRTLEEPIYEAPQYE
jgi:LCP family protein required for cell wall assembly